MAGSVAKKLGIKEGIRAFFANVPAEVIETMEAPPLDLSDELASEFDYIHCFVRTQQAFNDTVPTLKTHLKPTGMLWVSWPKGGKLASDLNLQAVITLAYRYGLIESKCISIDGTWSALKLTHPKAGKVYKDRS